VTEPTPGSAPVRPTLYLSNWASHRTPGMHGPGRTYTIMAKPRRWERGDGVVRLLRPSGVALALLDAALANRDDLAAMGAYRAAYEFQVASMGACLAPLGDRTTLAYLAAGGMDEGPVVPLRDGDTLCCACSRVDARHGRCHRAWAAPHLATHGWRVVLDGFEL
jgi:hypothetical protein